ncbi:MAG: lytic transglycosylase domain-containing protein [Deltaproteobacteria bacterium]|nr:lytic transglycosylase domain-containing protein [Deltaproteobacteria bacterium]
MEEETSTQSPALETTCWIAFIIGIIALILIPALFNSFSENPTVVEETGVYQFNVREPLEAHDIRPVSEDQVIDRDPSPEGFRLRPLVERAADRYDIDPALVMAIIMAESNCDPRAESSRGARGLMQLMPGTAKALGVEDSFDPAHNIDGGVRYFRQLLDQFDGDVRLALAAYNAGSRKVRMYQGVPPFSATHRYIEKVFAFYEQYKERFSPESTRA